MNISIIVPYVHKTQELKNMTRDCLKSFANEMKKKDELISIDDTGMILGNAGSWNKGIKNSKNEIILLSDNDIEARCWREPMLKALEKYDIVFPIVYNQSIGKEQRHLAGEFWMFKKSLIDEIGMIDEKYKTYFEDTDFFMRAINAGKILGIAEGSYVIHKSQGTVNNVWDEKRKKDVFIKNKEMYEKKFNGKYPSLS